jgi:tryptophan-rich sensory protein
VKAKKRRFQLPAICLPLAWLLCLAVMGLSMFLVWAYGISWGNDRVHQWLTSLVVSCCVSFLILEPAKVRHSFF